jgi:peptide/nickel transport system substrate-binding protein
MAVQRDDAGVHPVSRRRRLLAAGIGAAGALAAACGEAGTRAAERRTAAAQPAAPAVATSVPDREVVIAVSRDLANGTEDPFFVHSSAMVWEPLVGLDDSLRPVPGLAENWSLSDDGRVWTFTLRQNVRFADGTPFNADAVVANLQRYMKLSPRPSIQYTLDVRVGYGRLAEVRKVDERTVQFLSESPNPAMVGTMSGAFSAMFAPSSFAESGLFATLPVASGPYKIAEWKRAEYLLLERNEQYWGPKPAVRRIRLRVIPDPQARVSALIAREIDGAAELNALLPQQAQQLKGQPGITVGADPNFYTTYMAFNCAKPPFDDARLRRAVAMATDRESIVKDLVFGYGTAGRSILSPVGTQWFSAKGAVRYAPAEAQRLAADALGGRRVEVLYPFSYGGQFSRPTKPVGEVLQAALRPLGIDLKLQQIEGAALTDQVRRGEWDMYYTQIGWTNGDADFLMDRYIKSTPSVIGTPQPGYKNPRADELIDAARVERDQRKRFALYEQLQEIAAQDVPVYALFHEQSPYAFRDSITGLKQRVHLQPTLDTIKLR